MLSPGAEMWQRNVLPQGNHPEQSKLFWAGICIPTPLWQDHLLIISVTNFYLCLSVTDTEWQHNLQAGHVFWTVKLQFYLIFSLILLKKKSKFCVNYLLQVYLTKTILFTSLNQLCLSYSSKIHKVYMFSLQTLQDVRLYLTNCFQSAINIGKKFLLFLNALFFYPTS